MSVPLGVALEDYEALETLVATRRRLRRGEHLLRAGDAFEFLYAIRFGCLKSTVVSSDGRDQVTGFYMAGELLGFDGIAAECCTCDIVALDDTEVGAIPYARLEAVADLLPGLRRDLFRLLSREIVREHGVMLLLGSMRADERLASFLLSLSQRFEARGYSPSEFALPMTRGEIGSFLGLKLETVCRLLWTFARAGLLEPSRRRVRITNFDGLRAVARGDGASVWGNARTHDSRAAAATPRSKPAGASSSAVPEYP
jgi:CRP/FNR family transcriptional regulator